MVIKFALILTAIFSSVSMAQTVNPAFQVQNEIARLYQAKRYFDVTRKYEANKSFVLQNPQTSLLVNIAYEKLKRYPTALQLNFDYIQKNHSAETYKLMTALKNNEPIQSNDYSAGMKSVLFRIYGDYSQILLSAGRQQDLSSKQVEAFDRYKRALDSLEYLPSNVQKIGDDVAGHLKLLEQKVRRWKARVFIDYLSWQTSASLIGPYETTALLATNVGFCPGVGVSYENNFWAFSLDLSYLAGSGGVSATQGAVTYSQSDVSASGAKAALGVGAIVSSSRSELGLRATFLYVKQDLTTPSTPGYKIDQPNAFSQAISLYSRWTFNHFYFQTDFGRYVGRPATLWSLGFGYSL